MTDSRIYSVLAIALAAGGIYYVTRKSSASAASTSSTSSHSENQPQASSPSGRGSSSGTSSSPSQDHSHDNIGPPDLTRPGPGTVKRDAAGNYMPDRKW
jgi:hypothetical protein